MSVAEWLQEKAAEVAQKQWEAQLGGTLAEFHDADLEHVEGSPGQWLREWASRLPDVPFRNIVIGGPTGSGKTYAAVAMMKAAAAAGKSARFVRFHEYVTALRPDTDRPHWEVRAAAQEPFLLVVDDLGAGIRTVASEAVQREMIDLLSGRNLGLMVTVLTTNLTSDQVEEKFGREFSSRLAKDGAGLRVIHEDRRGRLTW